MRKCLSPGRPAKERYLAWRTCLAAALFLLTSGCDAPTTGPLLDQARLWLGLGGGPTNSRESALAAQARQNQVDLELLAEMYRVIYVRPQLAESERQKVVGLAQAKDQGASLEGLYNGLTHSAEYRQLESGHRNAAPDTLSAFAAVIGPIEGDLPSPTVFDASAAQPLPEPVEPSYRPLDPSERDASAGSSFTPAAPAKPARGSDPAALGRSYTETFVGASLFTLKRVAGDEALKLVAARAVTPEKLALWYSKWAVQTAKLGVDFGLPLRNSTDENFHYKWALEMPPDRLKWEVLNRVHRILNQSAVAKAPAAAGNGTR